MTVHSLYIYQTVLFGMQNMNKSFWCVGGVRGGLSWGCVAFFGKVVQKPRAPTGI